MTDRAKRPFLFPRWANYVVPVLLLAGAAGAPYMMLLLGLGGAPSTTDIGYQPPQPIPYSHQLHVNQLGMDCRYCHTTVETAAFAAIPDSATCMNCHSMIRTTSPNLQALYATFKDGMSIPWTKVHDLPDYAYFNHSAHINKGVGCVECHGRVDQMGAEGVFQKEELSMGWCLSCHRDPAPRLRPRDQVTNMFWHLDKSPEDRAKIGAELVKTLSIKSPQAMSDCSVCHR
jgi:hypothetical protein